MPTADGIGDFRGLTSKLDYLRDLGVTALWLLPFYPSPLRDDGYDIADYKSINPSYGTMADFRLFLREAHKRDLKVITELVINHTSDQHPWFQRARKAPAGSPERDFYVWSDDPELYKDARIIFQDTETSNWTWDPVANAYYWHRFFSHQPDLNFENPAVHEAVFDALDFWLAAGVDGLRLDAVPYLFERDGTMCENLPETHVFLKEIRARMDAKYDDRMLLAEANQWPEEAAAYFGDGDECHMCFHFPLMPRLFMSLRMENRFPIIDIVEQTPPIPENSAWAIFLRNHDELTLEMVTDEERDYMYRVYANDPQTRINVGIRRRLAPLLGNNRREMELMNALLLSLPGTPVLYYGDEIGMGDNVYLGDRNGVRTPMQWSGDRNAGFSDANPQRLYFPVITDPEYHYETVNVEVQRDNPNSMWWWVKRALTLRKGMPELSRGGLEFVPNENPKVLTFLRSLGERSVLVVANLSRHTQPVELDLTGFEGVEPVELFGRARFPAIGAHPYLLTLGPHDFFWFGLDRAEARIDEPAGLPRVNFRGELAGIFRAREQLDRVLLAAIEGKRWFRSKAQTISGGHIVDRVEVPGTNSMIVFLQVEYVEQDPEIYAWPIALATGFEAVSRLVETPGIGDLRSPLPVGDRRALRRHHRSCIRHGPGRSRRQPSQAERACHDALCPADDGFTTSGGGDRGPAGTPRRRRAVQHVDDLRRPGHREDDASRRPGAESRGGGGPFPHRAGGVRAFRPAAGGPRGLDEREGCGLCRRPSLRSQSGRRLVPHPDVALAGVRAGGRPSCRVGATAGSKPSLGHRGRGARRSGVGWPGFSCTKPHCSVSARARCTLPSPPIPDDPDFALQPLSTLYQRSLYQSTRSSIRTSFNLLRRRHSSLTPAQVELADMVLEREHDLLEDLRSVTTEKIDAVRLRIHGDYHLGQVLLHRQRLRHHRFRGGTSASPVGASDQASRVA